MGDAVAHRSVGNSIDLHVATFLLYASSWMEGLHGVMPEFDLLNRYLSAGAQVEEGDPGGEEGPPFQWNVNPTLSPTWQSKVRAMLDELRGCFSWSSKQLGKVRTIPPVKLLVKDWNFKSLRRKA